MMVLWMMSMHLRSSCSLIMRGGARRMMSPWVGLASSPLSRRRKHTSQALQSRESCLNMGQTEPAFLCLKSSTRIKPIRICGFKMVSFSTFGLFYDHCIKEAFSSDECHNVFGQFPQLSSKQLPHFMSIFCQLLLLQHLHIKAVGV